MMMINEKKPPVPVHAHLPRYASNEVQRFFFISLGKGAPRETPMGQDRMSIFRLASISSSTPSSFTPSSFTHIPKLHHTDT